MLRSTAVFIYVLQHLPVGICFVDQFSHACACTVATVTVSSEHRFPVSEEREEEVRVVSTRSGSCRREASASLYVDAKQRKKMRNISTTAAAAPAAAPGTSTSTTTKITCKTTEQHLTKQCSSTGSSNSTKEHPGGCKHE